MQSYLTSKYDSREKQMTAIEDSSSRSNNLPSHTTSGGLSLEDYCTEFFRNPRDLFPGGERRGRLHKVVSVLGSRKKGTVALSEDGSTSKPDGLSQDVSSIKEARKSVRKGTPSQTTEEAKAFFEFFMAKKRRRKQRPCLDIVAPDTVTAAVQPAEIFTEQQVAPVQSEAQVAPYPLNLDPTLAVPQVPLGATAVPHLIPFGDGTQQALVFFVNGEPPTSQEHHPAINGVSAGSAIIHVNIPVVQPEAVHKDGGLESGGGVIEKAMQLANVGSTMSEASTVQSYSACSTPNSLLIGSATHSMPHISEHVEVGPSSSTDNLPVNNVVQSVTIQTTQVPQTAAAGLFPAVAAEVKSAAMSRGSTCNGVAHSKKGIRYREIPTQTGDKEGVVSIADNMAEEAAQTSPMTSTQRKDKDRSKKQGSSERVRRHNCEVCNKMFYTNHDLKRHKLIHQDVKPFTCEICSKSFRTQSELKLHTPIHNEDTPYKCEYCGKEFRTKGCIKSHIKYHIGDKRHKCKECDRAFVKSADLKRHMAGHRNEKSYKCDQCESAFTRRDNLKAHMLLHSRSGVVTCDLCNKEFISSVYLKRHMHIHKQAKKKPYECQWCPKTYEQLEGLRRHIRQHVGDEKFVCKHCAKKFITSIQLKRHLWLSHDKESPYRRSVL